MPNSIIRINIWIQPKNDVNLDVVPEVIFIVKVVSSQLQRNSEIYKYIVRHSTTFESLPRRSGRAKFNLWFTIRRYASAMLLWSLYHEIFKFSTAKAQGMNWAKRELRTFSHSCSFGFLLCRMAVIDIQSNLNND